MNTLHQVQYYLKAQLKLKGFTLSQFALKSGVSQGGLSMILNHQRGMGMAILERIASALCLETWELLKESAQYEKTIPQKEPKEV